MNVDVLDHLLDSSSSRWDRACLLDKQILSHDSKSNLDCTCFVLVQLIEPIVVGNRQSLNGGDLEHDH